MILVCSKWIIYCYLLKKGGNPVLSFDTIPTMVLSLVILFIALPLSLLLSAETASDHSDIEGRVRALKDALKRRKMEADRLRKQQKRLNREKLKAQEASLKKQLEVRSSPYSNKIFLAFCQCLYFLRDKIC